MIGSTPEPIVDHVPIYSCGHCLPPHIASLPAEYIDETWETLGGGEFRYTSCFSCRGMVIPFDKSDLRWTPPLGPVRSHSPVTVEE